MRTLLIAVSLALVFSFGFIQISHAQCVDQGPSAFGGNLIDCGPALQFTPLTSPPIVDTPTGGDEVNIFPGGGVEVTGMGTAIQTLRGPDVVITSGRIITNDGSALNTGRQGDTVIVNGGEISTTDNPPPMGNRNGIVTVSGSDTVRVNGGNISSLFSRGISTGGAGDLVEINGGTITGGTRSIHTGSGRDTLRIHGGTLNEQIRLDTDDDNVLITGGTFNNTVGNAMINLGDGSDYLNIAADVDLKEQVNCGNDDDMMDFDTIEFSMEVPAQDVPALEDELNAQDPQDGSITIDGILYEWINCERLRANFNGIVTTLTIDPVASEVDVLTEATVTVTVISDNVPAPGLLVKFEITEGPNAGEMSDPGTGECFPDSCVTDENGQVSWTITSDVLGEDFIIATIDNPELGEVSSNIAQITWIVIRNIPTLSEWGIMAMAGVLGMAGLLFMRRKKAQA